MIASPRFSTLSRRSSRAWGFTLIELLVVISIILLLAALALPVLARASRQARAVICVANLKQLAACFRAYSTQNDGFTPASAGCIYQPTWVMPISPYVDRTKGFEGAPKGTVYPYYRDDRLVMCPSDKDGNGKFSYGFPNNIGFRIMDNVENPSEALLLIEEDPLYYLNSRESGFACADRPARRHGGSTPHASFDGQAKLTRFPPGYTARDFIMAPWGYSCGYRDWQ